MRYQSLRIEFFIGKVFIVWRSDIGNKKYESRHSAHKRKRAQRTWLFLTFGGIVLLGLAFLVLRGKSAVQPLASIEVQGAPSLKVDREQVDLGTQRLGNTVQVSFRLTNVGDQPLRFNDAPYIEVVEGC